MAESGPYDAERAKARTRAQAKYGFVVHAVVYAAVMMLLVLINVSTSPGTIWFIWPMMGWGLAVALHGARAFFMPGRDAIIDAMTERELDRMDAEHGNRGH